MIDFCNTEDATLLFHDVDLVIQEIDMLFDTSKGEVLGNFDYGTDFYDFLYDQNISASYISNYVKSSLALTNNHGFDINVDVKIYEGKENDIILIRITLSKEGEVWEKIYNIS